MGARLPSGNFCGVALIIATPCEGTSTEYSSFTVAMSLWAHRSWTRAVVPAGQPSRAHFAVTLAGGTERLRSTRACDRSPSGLAQTSRLSALETFAPWIPSGSWSTAMASLFVRISVISGFALRESVPVSSGAERMHHRLKWARFSSTPVPERGAGCVTGAIAACGSAMNCGTGGVAASGCGAASTSGRR